MKITFFLFLFFPISLFATSTLETRANTFYQEVRCPICLGQSIADSETDESLVLKTFILEKLKSGESEEAIREKLRLSIGDEILFIPPFKAHTLFLWLAPFGLFLCMVLGITWKAIRLR